MKAKISVRNLKVNCIIGEKDFERKHKQDIFVDLELLTNVSKAVNSDDISDAVDYEEIALEVKRFAEKSSFHLIEALADKIGDLILERFSVEKIVVRIRKPTALKDAEFAQVEIEKYIKYTDMI